MHSPKYQKWVISILGTVALLLWLIAINTTAGNLRVIFCDVGQGDSILIAKGNIQVLIDGGPDKKVLNCLGKYVAFWDRKIEFVVLTHPQADHMNGLIDVVSRYRVDQFVTGSVGNDTAGFLELKRELETRKIQVSNLYSGDRINIGRGSTKKIQLEVVWPDREWVRSHVGSNLETSQTDPSGIRVLGLRSDGTDLNSYSVGLELIYGEFNALFTGDADTQIENEIIGEGYLNDIEVLKVPHHGSKTGMSGNLLESVKPELAVISVGKNNRYGHPREEAIKLIRDLGIEIKRTDLDGDVVVETDGVGWKVVK